MNSAEAYALLQLHAHLWLIMMGEDEKPKPDESPPEPYDPEHPPSGGYQ